MLYFIIFLHQPYLCFYGKALCVGVFLWSMGKENGATPLLCVHPGIASDCRDLFARQIVEVMLHLIV